MLEVRDITVDDVTKFGNDFRCRCDHCGQNGFADCWDNVAEAVVEVDEAVARGFHSWQIVNGEKYCGDCMFLFWLGYQHNKEKTAAANASHADADHVKA